MSRASITTGNIVFGDTKNRITGNSPRTERSDDSPMHIAIIGNFSGHSEHKTSALDKRRIIEIDRDNFDEVFSSMKVQLRLPVCEDPIVFREFDDLHPDYIYQRVPLFDKLRILKRKLNKPELFAQAATEIQQWASYHVDSTDQSNSAESDGGDLAQAGNMLDAVLSQSQQKTDITRLADGDIDELIQDIVAPYVEPKSDPRLPEMNKAVDEATSQTLRQVMHSSAFQALEASWRSIYWLVRRLETQRTLKVFLIDIDQQEMLDDVEAHEELAETALYERLVKANQVPGTHPFSIFLFDIQLQDRVCDVRLASAFAGLAAASGGIAVTSASEKIAGCESFAEGEDSSDWQYTPDPAFTDAWRALRQQPSSEHLAACAPRFLLRLPYGSKSSPIESFDFEELSASDFHQFYLWGNGAYLLTSLLAHSFIRDGWNLAPEHEIEDLPLHIREEDGERAAQACAEIYLRDTGADKLAANGLLTLRSIRGRAAILLPRLRTIADNGLDITARLRQSPA